MPNEPGIVCLSESKDTTHNYWSILSKVHGIGSSLVAQQVVVIAVARVTAVVWVQALAWEPPHSTVKARKRKKVKNLGLT